MSELNCCEYSEKALVVRGEGTKTYKDELSQLGGKYNASLRGGAGWIFSKKSEAKVKEFIEERYKKCGQSHGVRVANAGDYDGFLETIRIRFVECDLQVRLKFLADVAVMMNNAVHKKVLQMRPDSVKESSSEEEDTRKLLSSKECVAVRRQISAVHKKVLQIGPGDVEEDSSEEEVPRKRLLGR
jgi:hypothetical protein